MGKEYGFRIKDRDINVNLEKNYVVIKCNFIGEFILNFWGFNFKRFMGKVCLVIKNKRVCIY